MGEAKYIWNSIREKVDCDRKQMILGKLWVLLRDRYTVITPQSLNWLISDDIPASKKSTDSSKILRGAVGWWQPQQSQTSALVPIYMPTMPRNPFIVKSPTSRSNVLDKSQPLLSIPSTRRRWLRCSPERKKSTPHRNPRLYMYMHPHVTRWWCLKFPPKERIHNEIPGILSHSPKWFFFPDKTFDFI